MGSTSGDRIVRSVPIAGRVGQLPGQYIGIPLGLCRRKATASQLVVEPVAVFVSELIAAKYSMYCVR
jgi:hypothetical protein